MKSGSVDVTQMFRKQSNASALNTIFSVKSYVCFLHPYSLLNLIYTVWEWNIAFKYIWRFFFTCLHFEYLSRKIIADTLLALQDDVDYLQIKSKFNNGRAFIWSFVFELNDNFPVIIILPYLLSIKTFQKMANANWPFLHNTTSSTKPLPTYFTHHSG